MGGDEFIMDINGKFEWDASQLGNAGTIGENRHLRKVKVDLYQWIHIPRRVRTTMLVNYSRRPDADPGSFYTTLLCPKAHLVMHLGDKEKCDNFVRRFGK